MGRPTRNSAKSLDGRGTTQDHTSELTALSRSTTDGEGLGKGSLPLPRISPQILPFRHRASAIWALRSMILSDVELTLTHGVSVYPRGTGAPDFATNLRYSVCYR